jgi:hypothetical protein
VGSGEVLVESLVRPGFVVVGEELLEYSGEMSSAEDQEVVERFAADGPDPALGVGVCTRASNGQPDDPDAFTREDLIEGAGELGVAITKEESNHEFAVLKLPSQIPSLLDPPLADGMSADPAEVDASAADLN